jgi:hypothetical protein
MYTLPLESTATPFGESRFEDVAAPAVGAPADPVPAKIARLKFCGRLGGRIAPAGGATATVDNAAAAAKTAAALGNHRRLLILISPQVLERSLQRKDLSKFLKVFQN